MSARRAVRIMFISSLLMLSVLIIPQTIRPSGPSAVSLAEVPVDVDVEVFVRDAVSGRGGSITIDNHLFIIRLWEDPVLGEDALEILEFIDPETGGIVIYTHPAPNYIYSGITKQGDFVQAAIAWPSSQQPYTIYLSLLIHGEDKRYSVETDINSGILRSMKYERTGGIVDFVGSAAAMHCPDETDEIYGSSDGDWFFFWGDSSTAAAKIQSMAAGMDDYWDREYPHSDFMQQGICTDIKLSGYMLHGYNDNTADDVCSTANGGVGPDSDTLWFDFITHLHSHTAKFHAANHFTAKTNLNCDGNEVSGMALINTANDEMGCFDTSDRRYSVTSVLYTDSDEYIGDTNSNLLLSHEIGHVYWGTHADAQDFNHCIWIFCHHAQTILFPGNQFEWHDHYSDANADTLYEYTHYSWQDPEKQCHYTFDESVYDDPCT